MNPSFTLTDIFWKKIRQQLRLEGLVEKKPKKEISLGPIDEDDLNIDIKKITAWSEENRLLYELIKKHGHAVFICNKQYLYQHYKTINFSRNNISEINEESLRLVNLNHLNLSLNKIGVIDNLPRGMVQLDVSYNLISQIRPKQNKLQYLNVNENRLGDGSLEVIRNHFAELRHLDIGNNKIIHIQKTFILKFLLFLKSLLLRGNPISLLNHYYITITNQIPLSYFDGVKYVKQEKKVEKVVEEVVVPTDKKEKEKKEAKKESKKDTKKDPKKEPEPEQTPVIPVVEEKKEININSSTFILDINVFSNLKLPLLEPQNCPNYEENSKQYLASYWVEYKQHQSQTPTCTQPVFFDAATIDDNKARISFSESYRHVFSPSVQFRDYISSGILLKVFSQEPKVITDPTSGEKKPEMDGGVVAREKKCQGIVFLNLEQLLNGITRKIEYQYTLFPLEAEKEAEFIYPYEDEDALILKNKDKLDRIRENREKEAEKQKEALLELAKKQGKKEVKKVEKKPPAKKGDKVEEEKRVEPSIYPKHPRRYVYASEDRIIEGKEYQLAVSVTIED